MASGKPNGESIGWTLHGTSYLFDGQWFKLRQDSFSRPGKGDGTYTYIEHPGSVFVVPVTADRRVILIRSYRFTLDTWCWEIPAGTLADHADASPDAAARRELREEAGAECASMLSLGQYYLGNGYANHLGHFFLAMGARMVVEPELDTFEQIDNVASFPLSKVSDMIRNHAVRDGDSALALLLAFQRLTAGWSVEGNLSPEGGSSTE